MDAFLRWLAAIRGVEVEAGSELRLELSSFPAGGLGFLVVLSLLATLAIVVFAYRRDAHRLSRGRRVTLAMLRAAAVLVAFVLLLEPNLVAVKRDVRAGSTIVLIDTSQSMAQNDPYHRVPELAQSWRDLGAAQPEAATRIELAARVFEHDEQRMLRELAEHNDVFVYGFHAGLDALASFEQSASEPLTADGDRTGSERFALPTLDATGRFTDLGLAVRSALERHRDSAIAGLVVMSDGRRNLGAQGSEIARLLEQRKVARTLVLPIGDPSATQTVRLTRIDAPDKVFQKDPFTIRANIESQGYERLDSTVVLRREREGGDGEVETVRTVQVQTGVGVPQSLVEFTDLRATEAGVYTYRVEVEPPEFETPNPERHTQRAQIEVLGEQTRVLLISGGPSHEFRFLRTQLIRDQTVEVSTWLSSADPDFPQDGNVVLDRLPEGRDELEEYDVFVLLDPNAQKLTPTFCENVRKQVEENGAGLWWVCGEIYTLDALRETASTRPLVEILPVVPDLERADERLGLGRARNQPIAYRLTPDGAAHKLARLLDTREASERLWGVLPGCYFVFPVERAKPGAVVIAEYADASVRQYGKIPLIATQFFGTGRVTFTGTDDTNRWRALHEHAYQRFWVNGLRYLFEGRLSAGNNRLTLSFDADRLELGTSQRIVADVRTETFTPWLGPSFEVVLEADTDAQPGGESLHLTPVEGVPGQYEARFWPTAVGFYRVRPAEVLGREVQATFQVVPAEIEKAGPTDLAELGALALASGASLCATPVELLARVREIESASIVEKFASSHAVWDSWFTIALILGLLSAEWWLRKRSNLL